MVLVFVSHASRDKELVEALKALFTNTGLLVKEEELFVSSIDGCDVDDGEDFLVEIRTKLREATLAIPIITPAYLDSEFCHWELGAIWASDAMWFPLRLGIETDQLPTLIKTRQVKELGRGPLNGIRKRVQRLEEGRAVRDDLWRAECTSLLNEVPDIVTSLQGGWNTTSRNLERIEARVGQASGLLREAMYSIREAGWTALTVKAGEPSKAFRLSLRHVAKEIKRLFVHTTGKQIRVSIKQLVYEEGPPDGEGPAIRLGAQELARDDPNHVRGATDLVDDNTALCHIVKGEEEYFFSNRLSALRGYKNSHFPNGSPTYESTIVWAIRKKIEDEETVAGHVYRQGDSDFLGFLCVDSASPEAFSRHDAELLAACATALFLPLRLWVYNKTALPTKK